MSKAIVTSVLLGIVLCARLTLAQRSDCDQWPDPAGDAALRRTDYGNDGAVGGSANLPDVVRATLCPWEAFDPEGDRYSGRTVDGSDAHLFRIDLEFRGLLNPPGPLGLNGDPFEPFRFGPSPLVGFVDIDVDDRGTGGELDGGALVRYLANAARFGRLPGDSLGHRAATCAADLDGDFYTPPQYERSGADFAIVFCGCATPTTLELWGDGDGVFEADETWLVFGRFFERAQGYREASAAFGGSAPGLYDPIVEIRFEHSSASNLTTVTLVWALDPVGAASLVGETVQPIDLNVANHASVVEALDDIIEGARGGDVPGPAWVLVQLWADEEPWDHVDVEGWKGLTGLFGTPYALPEPSLYVWTDTLGEEAFGDMDGDEDADQVDEQLVRDSVYERDGSWPDADGLVNGRVVIAEPGTDFSLYDTDGNMVIDLYDQAPYGPLGDFNGNGIVDTQDVIAFLNAWAMKQPLADFNLDQVIDTRDFIVFLNAWAAG